MLSINNPTNKNKELLRNELMTLVKLGIPKNAKGKTHAEKKTTILKELKINTQTSKQLFKMFPDCEKEYNKIHNSQKPELNTLEDLLNRFDD